MYLYFSGLSFRRASRALGAAMRRSHTSIWKWVHRYRYSPVPVSFSWSSPVYDSTPGIRYLWGSTGDNFGASLGQSGSFSMPAQPATVQGNYGSAQGGGGIQYLLTMAANPSNAGSTDPAVGAYWEPAGTALSIGATPNSGWAFVSWTGSGSRSYSGTLQYPSITMDGSINETANFEPVVTFSPTGLPSSSPNTSCPGMSGGLEVPESSPPDHEIPAADPAGPDLNRDLPGSRLHLHVLHPQVPSELLDHRGPYHTSIEDASVIAVYHRRHLRPRDVSLDRARTITAIPYKKGSSLRTHEEIASSHRW
ncbi:MAG: InlB B-repeat-containing protein [Conexivisphaera sp.]|jgi:hypothetical protein